MKICITNNLGRPYLFTYMPQPKAPNYTGYLELKRGINIVEDKLFNMIKDHPQFKYYLGEKLFVVSSAIQASKNDTQNKKPEKDNKKPEEDKK